jgi:hypothetical protein
LCGKQTRQFVNFEEFSGVFASESYILNIFWEFTHLPQSFTSMLNFWSPPTLQFPVSLDLDRLKLGSRVKPEKDSLSQGLPLRIPWHRRREPVAQLIEATTIKLRNINGA